MKVAINGFGRIGRTFFRQAFGAPGIDVVAINDLGDKEALVYLIKYDTVYGRYDKDVKYIKEEDGKEYFVIDNPSTPDGSGAASKKILLLAQKDPAQLPWKDLDIDVAVESTGAFESEDGGKMHTQAGAKYVVISAPAKGNVPHVLVGVNTEDLKNSVIVSNASCTTNCTGPVASVMYDNPGIEKAILATVHGYTATQSLVDGPAAKDKRRGRAAALNIVPSTTGAAEATAKAIPGLEGIFTGIALRVPVAAGSIIDFTFVAKRNVTPEEINDIFRKASREDRWKGILEVTEEPLVSSDILKTEFGAMVDLSLTRVVDGNLVKVMAWYDNEWGYSSMLLREVIEIGKIM